LTVPSWQRDGTANAGEQDLVAGESPGCGALTDFIVDLPISTT
jgi:hypothetical protein